MSGNPNSINSVNGSVTESSKVSELDKLAQELIESRKTAGSSEEVAMYDEALLNIQEQKEQIGLTTNQGNIQTSSTVAAGAYTYNPGISITQVGNARSIEVENFVEIEGPAKNYSEYLSNSLTNLKGLNELLDKKAVAAVA